MLVTTLIVFSLLFMVAEGFVRPVQLAPKTPLTIHYYDYFKKNKDGSKKEVGRLLKNIIFPGIYVEYADTKETIKEVKVKTKTEKGIDRSKTAYKGLKQGRYNVADEKSIPTYSNAAIKNMKKLAKPKKPDGFKAPEPKKALIGGKGGVQVLPDIKQYTRAKKPIVMYEYEGNGECRIVREACTMLDLNVEFRPCPGTTSGFSDQLSTISLGKRDVPYMVDDNPSMYRPRLTGAADIIEHLFDTYGPGAENIPKQLKGKGKSGGKGNRLSPQARPDSITMKPLTLYGWEGAKFVTPVREALNELGLAHVFVNCAEGSLNRAKLTKITKGNFQVPYIVDPNTGVSMFESAEIVKYLQDVYTI